MGLAGHAARMGRAQLNTEVWWGSLRERDGLGDLCIGGKILKES
jgi:hypothetical protein